MRNAFLIWLADALLSLESKVRSLAGAERTKDCHCEWCDPYDLDDIPF